MKFNLSTIKYLIFLYLKGELLNFSLVKSKNIKNILVY